MAEKEHSLTSLVLADRIAIGNGEQPFVDRVRCAVLAPVIHGVSVRAEFDRFGDEVCAAVGKNELVPTGWWESGRQSASVVNTSASNGKRFVNSVGPTDCGWISGEFASV